MSAIVLLPILIPVTPVLWPILAGAASATAGALGFTAVKGKVDLENATEVELPMEHSSEVSDQLTLGEDLVFQKGAIRVVFSRNTDGQVRVRVCGQGVSDSELRSLGAQIASKVVQQYAYHRLVTELKENQFHLVSEQVEADGTVRLQVRRFE